MKNLKALLSSKGIKPTYQRIKILEYLRGQKHEHPTVDRVYQDMVREMPSISRTTVYNTLKSFTEKGIVSTLMITGTEARFDFAETAHHHFFCSECGKITDIEEITCPHFHRHEIRGNVIKELHGYFKGICSECNKSKGRKP